MDQVRDMELPYAALLGRVQELRRPMLVSLEDVLPCPSHQVVQLVVAFQRPKKRKWKASDWNAEPSRMPFFRSIVQGALVILATAVDSCVVPNASCVLLFTLMSQRTP